MRRKDREMDREFANGVIDSSSFGSIALWDEKNQETYSLPLSIVRVENTLYFHSAKSGRKVELLKEGNVYGLSFVSWNEVPKILTNEDIKEMIKDKTKIPRLLSRVFTTQFASATVKAKCRIVTDEKEILMAMEKICKKYTRDKMEFFTMAMEAGGPRINVYALDIITIQGKRKQLDSSGEEMKWGRME
ncbi:MAG: pyridoxamine 5'-phosphate oxidase family protein [Tissierellia bacterium]|nr:pyridoxamine 5'-phosphate oxidase family protein [Tissierellia bacterium]